MARKQKANPEWCKVRGRRLRFHFSAVNIIGIVAMALGRADVDRGAIPRSMLSASSALILATCAFSPRFVVLWSDGWKRSRAEAINLRSTPKLAFAEKFHPGDTIESGAN